MFVLFIQTSKQTNVFAHLMFHDFKVFWLLESCLQAFDINIRTMQ